MDSFPFHNQIITIIIIIILDLEIYFWPQCNLICMPPPAAFEPLTHPSLLTLILLTHTLTNIHTCMHTSESCYSLIIWLQFCVLFCWPLNGGRQQKQMSWKYFLLPYRVLFLALQGTSGSWFGSRKAGQYWCWTGLLRRDMLVSTLNTQFHYGWVRNCYDYVL